MVLTLVKNHLMVDGGGGGDDSTKILSFKDMCLTGKVPQITRLTMDLIEQKLAKIEFEDGNPLKPTVIIDDSMFEGLYALWQEALVIKLIGKSIGFHDMKERLTRIWKLNAGFEILDIDHGYYMITFDQEAYRVKLIGEEPWMIFDNYLIVELWTPDFISPVASINKTMVWIRFPGLNLVYYDETILLALASAIGKPVKVDINPKDVRRGRFARVCIEVNLTKPVVGRVWLKDLWYHVEYEGLHRICGTCGCYGHLMRECKVEPTMETNNNTQGVNNDGAGQFQPPIMVETTIRGKMPPILEEVRETMNVTPTIMNDLNENNSNHKPDLAVTDSPLHGEWLVMQRRKANNQQTQNKKEGKAFMGPF